MCGFHDVFGQKFQGAGIRTIVERIGVTKYRIQQGDEGSRDRVVSSKGVAEVFMLSDHHIKNLCAIVETIQYLEVGFMGSDSLLTVGRETVFAIFTVNGPYNGLAGHTCEGPYVGFGCYGYLCSFVLFVPSETFWGP